MANFKLPGPLCQLLNALEIDFGTMCRSASSPPGVLKHSRGVPKRKLQKTHNKAKVALAVSAGVSTKLTAADFHNAATSLGSGISAALVRAFAEVESGGKSGFGPSGLPIIAFEGHIFRRYTKRKYDATHSTLSYKYHTKAGPEWKANNKNQTQAWKTLKEAIKLDHSAALMSCSWGMFQVMGFNFKMCGYKSVDDFVTAMKAGEQGQLQAFIGYCKKAKGCVAAMQKKDFAGMAKAYNGADYGNYDKMIEKAYKRHGGT